MPLVTISHRRGKDAAYESALIDGVYAALRESFNVPEDDCFMTVSAFDPHALRYGATYLGIERTDDIVLVQIVCSATRDLATKRAFYRRLADGLAQRIGLRREDVFITLVETKPENWSFGLGEAQYV